MPTTFAARRSSAARSTRRRRRSPVLRARAASGVSVPEMSPTRADVAWSEGSASATRSSAAAPCWRAVMSLSSRDTRPAPGAGGAGAPALHLGRGEGVDVARQGLRGRRKDEGAGGAGGCAEEQERDQQRERRAATGHERYFTPRTTTGTLHPDDDHAAARHPD